MLRVICVEVFITFVLVFLTAVFLLMQQFDTQVTYWGLVQWKSRNNITSKEQLRVTALDWIYESTVTETQYGFSGYFLEKQLTVDCYGKTNLTKHTKIMLNFYQLFKARHLISWIERNGKKFRFMILFLPYAIFFPYHSQISYKQFIQLCDWRLIVFFYAVTD